MGLDGTSSYSTSGFSGCAGANRSDVEKSGWSAFEPTDEIIPSV